MTAVPYLQPLALPAPTRRAWRSNKEVLDALRDRHRPRHRGRAGAAGPPRPHPAPHGDVARGASSSPSTCCCPSSATSATRPRPPARPTGGGWPRWCVGAAATIVFAALAFVASVPEPISYLPALRMQIASSFVSRIAPANTGTLAIGVRFLQRSGLDPGPAAAAVGLSALAGFVVHLAAHGRLPAVGRVERRRVLAARGRRDLHRHRGGRCRPAGWPSASSPRCGAGCCPRSWRRRATRRRRWPTCSPTRCGSSA